MSEVVIVVRDKARDRDMYWSCNVHRFTYYEEYATVFDSEDDASVYMRYAQIKGATLASPPVVDLIRQQETLEMSEHENLFSDPELNMLGSDFSGATVLSGMAQESDQHKLCVDFIRMYGLEMTDAQTQEALRQLREYELCVGDRVQIEIENGTVSASVVRASDQTNADR